MPTWDILIKGRVQGVGFRHFVYEVAKQYAVRGFVKNLVDGSVKIVASADEIVFAEFCARIRQGNSIAIVRDMDISLLIGAKEYDDFSIG